MARRYKRCLSCGADVSPLAQRCNRCGSLLSGVPLEIGEYVCEQCEAPLPGGSRFCPACGFAFDEAVPVVEAAPPLGFRPAASSAGPPPVTAVFQQSAPGPPPPLAATVPPPPPRPAQAGPKAGIVFGALAVLFWLGFGLSRAIKPPVTTALAAPAIPPPPAAAAVAPVAPIAKPDTHVSITEVRPVASPRPDAPPQKQAVTAVPPKLVMEPVRHVQPTADDADTLSAFAPPGSGLTDIPFDTNSLQNNILTPSDLKHRSLRALSLSHNSIYALHGYVFERPSMKSYFEAQPWYRPNPSFSSAELSPVEQQNAQTIRAVERARFGYGRASFGAQGQTYDKRDPLSESASSGSGLNNGMIDMDTLQHRLLTTADLSDKSLAALSVSYNAIYAAHGYVFKRASLRHLFEAARWYRPNPAFQESDLTGTERANLQTIRSYERARFGY